MYVCLGLFCVGKRVLGDRVDGSGCKRERDTLCTESRLKVSAMNYSFSALIHRSGDTAREIVGFSTGYQGLFATWSKESTCTAVRTDHLYHQLKYLGCRDIQSASHVIESSTRLLYNYM